MIDQHQDESRESYLMRVAAEYINRFPDLTIEYDGTECDGYCLAEELAARADNIP